MFFQVATTASPSGSPPSSWAWPRLFTRWPTLPSGGCTPAAKISSFILLPDQTEAAVSRPLRSFLHPLIFIYPEKREACLISRGFSQPTSGYHTFPLLATYLSKQRLRPAAVSKISCLPICLNLPTVSWPPRSLSGSPCNLPKAYSNRGSSGRY